MTDSTVVNATDTALSTDTNSVKVSQAETVEVKGKKAGKGKRKVVRPPKTYAWSTKGPKSTPTQLLVIDGKERSFELGSINKLKVSQFKATEPQHTLMNGILAQLKAVPTTLTLSCKAGYKGAQFGFTKANLSNAWSGFLTVTDGELCLHAWPQRAISKQALLNIAESCGIKPNRQGANWFTIADGYLTGKYLAKTKKFCLACLKLAK